MKLVKFALTPPIAAISVALFAALSSFGTTYYVDYETGDNGNNGTTAPWKTLAYAVSADSGVVDDDEIVLAKGPHVCSDNLVIDKKLHIHGAGDPSETVFDAEHKAKSTSNPHVKITADGALINNLTFSRLCGGQNHNCGLVTMSGASAISNVVFTASGNTEGGNNGKLVVVSKGVLTRCAITGNDMRYGPIVNISGTGLMENCLVYGNSIATAQSGIIEAPCGENVVIRNCTITGNDPYTMQAVRLTYSGGKHPKFYNNIIYGNSNRDLYFRKWYANNLICNCVKSPVLGDSEELPINYVNPQNKNTYAGKENVDADPKMDATTMRLTASSPFAVKTGAKTGVDADGVAYCSSYDFDGNPRGETPSMGAYQYVAAAELVVNVFADKTNVRLPETIRLYCEVEGAKGDLTYAWDFDNDGTVDSTVAEPVLADAGEYASVKVTVSDGTTSKTSFYDGVITVLPKYLEVTLSADKTVVRTPGVITLSAAIADQVAAPLSYSWDLDGDGVEDSTSENPVLSEVGVYENPTLLCVTDSEGRYSDKVVLAGTYAILPAEPQTFTVNVGDSFAEVLAQAFDGDEIVLKTGTHALTGNLVVSRPITIRGEGENWETVLDANHKATSTSAPHLKITADGVRISNLTFYRLCGGNYHNCGQFVLAGDSVVSNCVFTGCGLDAGGDNKLVVDVQAGALTCCWVTNNVSRYHPLVQIQGAKPTECDNCVIADNRVVTENASGAYGLFNVRTGLSVVRNCTVANNSVIGKYCALSVHYASGAANAGTNPKIYNTIVWGNTNTDGAVRDVYVRRWYLNNFIFNDTTKVIGDDNLEYELNAQLGYSFVGKECMTVDPAFAEAYALGSTAGETLKYGAKPGADAAGVSYCTAFDIYGKPRGDAPSMGAVQYVASSTLTASIGADKTTARLPETITLTATVEGAASEDVVYEWDVDGDGETDGTEATYVLDQVGTYDSVSVKVSDGQGTVIATYDGTLTILEELLAVTIVANGKTVRQPEKLVFRAEIANDYQEPLAYSWDTDGDGVADSDAETVEYSDIGLYSAPKLIAIVDANGKRNDNITLGGVFCIHSEQAQTYYVDYANGDDAADGSSAHPWKTLAFATSRDFLDDGDEIILKRGQHDIRNVITVSKGLHVHGEGEREDTVLDANYGNNNSSFWYFEITGKGALVNNMTFSRFGHTNGDRLIRLNADAVVSNVVVRNCGVEGAVYSGVTVDMQAGLFTHSFVSNNVAGYCAGISMNGVSTLENCAILYNRSIGNYEQGAALQFPHGKGRRTVRNCTIAGNTFAKTGNAAIYGYAWETSKESAHLYNNIVWGNTCTTAGAIHPNANNYSGQKWFVKNNCWDYDAAGKLQDPDGGTDYGNVNADPRFDAVHGGAPLLSLPSPCRNKGDDEYATKSDVDIMGGKRRVGRHIDIGCVECQNGPGFGILVR